MNLQDVRTDKQLRAMAVEIAQSWVGIREGSEGHKVILGIYNNHKPLARSYKVKTTDAWCATTVSAIYIVLEMTDFAPTECSCTRMIELYKAKGQFIEDDNYVPTYGDILMYDWEDNGVGDNKGAPNHVGIVEKVVNGKITVIEGNYSNRVKRRVLSVGGKYIRGYCIPDYEGKVKEILKAMIPRNTTFLVCLDAAHGNDTDGKCVPYALDKKTPSAWSLNDRVCDYIAERANRYEGFGIVRVDDPDGSEDVDLYQRYYIANMLNADFYLNINHTLNKGTPWDGGGITALCSKGSNISPAWRDALYDAVINAGGISGKKDKQNYTVLTETDIAAVVMECGYMDSRVDYPIIKTDSYAKKIGYAMADCIARRAGLKVRKDCFIDVPKGAYYDNALYWAVENGITDGVTANTFAPNQNCNRAQTVTMLWRMSGCDKASNKLPFVDIAEDAFYYKAIAWAYSKGISIGVDDKHYKPNAVCNRAQIVTMLYRMANCPSVTGYSCPFVDVKKPDFYYEAVLWAYKNGIIKGVDSTHFAPKNPCKRCELVEILYRYSH